MDSGEDRRKDGLLKDKPSEVTGGSPAPTGIRTANILTCFRPSCMTKWVGALRNIMWELKGIRSRPLLSDREAAGSVCREEKMVRNSGYIAQGVSRPSWCPAWHTVGTREIPVG